MIDPESFRQRTIAHYRESFAEHGASPRGVDWNGQSSQEAHFAQLLKLMPDDAEAPISINDFGCGYGAFAGYVAARRREFRYYGCDLNDAMIQAAQTAYSGKEFTFEVADTLSRYADYGVASGVFTLRLGRSDDECWKSLLGGIDMLDQFSRTGFAFNCLTSYSDESKMRDYLYYPDPCRVFDYCKTHISKQVALLHDYGLFAFTILVRRPGEMP